MYQKYIDNVFTADDICKCKMIEIWYESIYLQKGRVSYAREWT